MDSRGRTAYVGTTLAATKHRPRTKYALHRFIFGLTDPKIEVDHWNGDALDCRRSNMYVVDRQKNQQNRPALSSTGHRNVYWRKRQKDYVVRARRDDKGFWGGRFDVLAEAVLAARALRTSVFAHANEARASEVKPSGARRKRHAH